MSCIRRKFILLALGLIGAIQSQPPTPGPTKSAQTNQQNKNSKKEQVNSNDDKTERGVTVINQFYPNSDSGDEPQGKERSNQNTFVDTLTAISTFLLAVFTLVLAAATVALCYVAWLQRRTMQGHERALATMSDTMIKGLDQTTKAADAAAVSASAAQRTLVTIERPKLAVRFMSSTAPPAAIHGHFLLFNTGSTKATLSKVRTEIVMATNLPQVAPYEDKPGELLTGRTELLPGQSAEFPFPSSGSRTWDFNEWEEMEENLRPVLYVVGWIEYLDDSQRVRRMGFCRAYNADTKRYQRVEDEDYEYDD